MEYLIEVESAAAEPAVLRFKLGREVGPFHVGGKGKWRVSASGVADKHAYLYFDGAQLFLQSVSAETPVLADGRPLPCEWVPIAAPCEIALGDARLRYDALEEIEVENPDTADQPLVPPPAPSAPGAPGGRPKLDSDATRLVPIEELHAKRRAITGSELAGKRVDVFAKLYETPISSCMMGPGFLEERGVTTLKITNERFADTDGDGNDDFSFTLERAHVPGSPALGKRAVAQCKGTADGTEVDLSKLAGPSKRFSLEFKGERKTLVPTAATKKLLDAWGKESPEDWWNMVK